MAITVETILKNIGKNVNGVSETPTGDELTAWLDHLEEANREWADAFDPQVLVKTHYATMPVSATSVSLPDAFKEKFAGYIKVNGSAFEEFDPVEASITSGDYVTWGGDQGGGYYLNLNRALTSAASLAIPYHSRPSSLTTLSLNVVVPIPEFLTDRTTEKVMLQRSQPEYVEFQVRADLLLQRMVAREATADIQKNKTIRSSADYNNFQIGED